MNVNDLETERLLRVTLINMNMLNRDKEIDWQAIPNYMTTGLPHPLNFHSDEELAQVATRGYTRLLTARTIYQHCKTNPPTTYERLLTLAKSVRELLVAPNNVSMEHTSRKQAPFVYLVRLVALLNAKMFDLTTNQMVNYVFGTHTPESLACGMEVGYINEHIKACSEQLLIGQDGHFHDDLNVCVNLKRERTVQFREMYPIPVIRVCGFEIAPHLVQALRERINM